MSEIALPGQPALPSDETPNRDIKVMALIGLVHGSSHFFQLVLPPLFPFLKDEFQVSYTELGAVMTVFFIVSGLAQTAAGFAVDRFGARNVLMGGLGLYCLGILLYGIAPSFWLLVPAAVLAGLGNSVFHPADFSILNASVNQKRLGRAYGAHTLGGNLGWATAPVVMAGGAALFGWRAAIVIAAAVGIAILLTVVLNRDLLREDSGAARRKAMAEADAPKEGNAFAPLLQLPVLLSFGYFLLLALALIGVQNFLPPTLDALHGTPLVVATSALTGFLLGASVGVMLGAWVADRGWRLEYVVTGGLLSAAIMMLVVSSVNLPAFLLIGAIALAGALQGFTTPSRDLIVRGAAPKGASGRIFGFVYSGLDAGSAIAPLVIGLLLDHGRSDRVLWFVAAALALTTLTAVTIRRNTLARRAAE